MLSSNHRSLRRSGAIGVAALAALLVGCSATPAPATNAQRPSGQPIRAAFLVVDGVYNTELIAPYDIFEHVRYHDPNGLGIEVFTVSPDGLPIRSAEGLQITPDFSFDNAPEAQILVVPSAAGSRDVDLENEALIQWVREAGQRADHVMSLCWGAFVLAKAGLLEDRACTTFPRDFARFTETFPTLDLRFNVSFVHDGNVLTSQGGVKSFEAAMYMVDRLFGEKVAIGVGSGLLIDWPPKWSQAPVIVSRP